MTFSEISKCIRKRQNYTQEQLARELGNPCFREEFRPCLKNGNVPGSERFFRQTRRFDAGILCVLQGKSTRYGEKRSAAWACCPFIKQGLEAALHGKSVRLYERGG